jgi:Ca2+-binding EF-hand superfamily protein
MNWKTGVTALALGAAVVFATGSLATQAYAGPKSSMLKSLDTDNDGTVDMDEARVAANALFDQLDKDHEGTLDRKELRGRISAKDLAAADPDHDGTLTKDEYANFVATRFKAADPDNDGTLDAKEIKSVARLLK